MKKESQINVGDKVFVPFELLLVRDSGDFPYYLGHDTSRILANEEMLEQWKKESGCANGSGKTYEDGLNEAWELAKKIVCYEPVGGLPLSQLEEIFGIRDYGEIVARHTAQEAAAKIAEWESKQEIRVGDVVNAYSNVGVVVKEGENYISVLTKTGTTITCSKDIAKKTGRTIDIAALLAQIGGTRP